MHFTEDEIREIRNRLPLEVPTVTDSLQSSDGSSALSAKQGNLLGGRLALVESTEAAMRNIQTIYPWAGASGIYSMVSAPDDTVNNATNAKVAYELKKRTDDLASRVTTIENVIDSLNGGGGGGGTYILPVASDITLGGVKIGSDSGLSIDAYGFLSVTGGGGGGGTGYIGSTQVRSGSTTGVYDLTGLKDASFSGNLSVTGTSTLTGNVTIGGTVFLPATGKIVFGSNASTDPFIEYVAGTTNQFHFSKGLYSDYNVTAGGVGTGGGGGGASSLNDLSDVTIGTLTSADDGKVLAFDYDSGTNPQWKPKALTIQDIAGISSPTTGYLKYDNGSWSLSSSTANVSLGTASQDSSGVTDIDTTSGRVSDGQVLCYNGTAGKWKYTTVQGVGSMYLGGNGHASSLSDVNIASNTTVSNYSTLYYDNSAHKWKTTVLALQNLWDVNFLTTAPSSGDYLKFNGSQWVPAAGSGGTSVSWGTVSGYTAQLTVGNETKTVCLNGYSTGGGGTGTVTSVGLSMPSCFTVTGSPVTTSGTLTASFSSQTANYVLAAPSSASGTPSFRALDAADIPSLSASKITSGTLDSGRIPDLSGTYVTLTTDQHTISGAKSFTNSAGIGIGSSSHTLKYNSSQNRFEFNGNLYVTGNIIATGAVTAGA